ncbi:hypothetical protein SDC9_165061 [bioreactor metagenome]|uniref:Uncharacterized protein n=1 Tax=bioreactor metagenome TaxID=1076179 RepID=A0A645FV70_9ZZZZ
MAVAQEPRVPRGVKDNLLRRSQHHQRLDLAAVEVLEQLVKIAVLVIPAENQHRRACHCLHRLDGRIRVCALGVVDIRHALELAHELNTVLHAGERFERFAHGVRRNAHAERQQRG